MNDDMLPKSLDGAHDAAVHAYELGNVKQAELCATLAVAWAVDNLTGQIIALREEIAQRGN